VFGAGNPHRYIVDRIADHYMDSVEHTWLVRHGGYRLFRMPITSLSSWRFNGTNRPVPVAMRIVKPFQTPEIVRMHRPFAAVAVLSTAAAILALAGCGSSSATNPSQTSFKSLPVAEQQEFETVATDEVVASITSMTSFSPFGSLGFDRVAAHRSDIGSRMTASKRARRFHSLQADTSCEVLSGNQTTNSLGIPVADTITWNNCTFASDGDTSTINGFEAYGDPTPDAAGINVADAANLTLTFASAGDGDLSLSLVGSGAITQGSGAIDETGNWALNEQISNSPSNDNGTFKLSANETATYTYGGAALTSFGSLPEPGTFNLSGNWSWNISTTSTTVNLSFSVSTPTPLTVDGCSGNAEGIDSGEIDIKFSDGTLVKAVWTGCAATPSYTIT
jgi:hypothetical protein